MSPVITQSCPLSGCRSKAAMCCLPDPVEAADYHSRSQWVQTVVNLKLFLNPSQRWIWWRLMPTLDARLLKRRKRNHIALDSNLNRCVARCIWLMVLYGCHFLAVAFSTSARPNVPLQMSFKWGSESVSDTVLGRKSAEKIDLPIIWLIEIRWSELAREQIQSRYEIIWIY